MNIFVKMKRTFDTEEKIMIKNGKVTEDGVEWIINPYDEYAVEEAISLKEKHGGDVTVVTFREEEATIFSIADYGIVADLNEVLPLLIEEFKILKVGV